MPRLCGTAASVPRCRVLRAPRKLMLGSLAIACSVACGRMGFETLDGNIAAQDGLTVGGWNAAVAPTATPSIYATAPNPSPGAPTPTPEPTMTATSATASVGTGSAGTGSGAAGAGGNGAVGGSAGVGNVGGASGGGGTPGAGAGSAGVGNAGTGGTGDVGAGGSGDGTADAPGGVEDGLVGWFDAWDESFPDGALVDTWGDAQQSDPAAMPTYVVDGINGGPVIRFDGIDDILLVEGFAGLTDFDVFAVWQSPVLPPTDGFTHILRHGTEDTENFELTYGSPYDIALHAAALSSGGEWAFAKFEAPAINTPYLWNSTYESTLGDLTARTNGGVTTINDGAPRAPDVGAAVLAIGGRAGPDRLFTGDIAEIVIYNRALDAMERDGVEEYLASKWGLSLQ